MHARPHLYYGTVSAACLLIFSFPIDPSWFVQPNLDCHSVIQSALELSILLLLPPKLQVCTTRPISVYNLSVERPRRAKWKPGWGSQLLCCGSSYPGGCSLDLVCLRTNGVLACRKLSDEGILWLLWWQGRGGSTSRSSSVLYMTLSSPLQEKAHFLRWSSVESNSCDSNPIRILGLSMFWRCNSLSYVNSWNLLETFTPCLAESLFQVLATYREGHAIP